MYETIVLKEYLAHIGMFTSLCLNLAPLPTFLFCGKSQEERLTMLDSISYLYLLTGISTNAIWLSYGFKVQNYDVITNNTLGLILSLMFISLYLAVKKSKEELLQFFTFFPLSLAFFLTMVSADWCGLIGSILSITCCLAPLEKIPKVIQSRDYRFINMPVATFTLFNGSTWCIYGILTNDIFIGGSAVVAVLSATIQILFFLWARKTIPEDFALIRLLVKLFSYQNVLIKYYGGNNELTGVTIVKLDPRKEESDVDMEVEKITEDSTVDYNTITEDGDDRYSDHKSINSSNTNKGDYQQSSPSKYMDADNEQQEFNVLDSDQIKINILS